MFENFADTAIHVVMTAQRQARRLGHERLGTGEVLLALAQERSGLVGHIMESAGFSLNRCLVEIHSGSGASARANGEGRGAVRLAGVLDLFTPMALSPDTIRLVEAANALAGKSGAQKVQPEHILLALCELHDCRGCQLLAKSGVQMHTLRSKILSLTATH